MCLFACVLTLAFVLLEFLDVDGVDDDAPEDVDYQREAPGGPKRDGHDLLKTIRYLDEGGEAPESQQ